MTQDAFSRRRPREYDGNSSAERAVFAATEKLLSTKSLQDLTVADILDEAGLSRANFYHYFANKYSVVVALLSRLLEESYGASAPWEATPGRTRARTLGGSLDRTLDMWSSHGPVICAVIEHMHTQPAVAGAWRSAYGRFVDSVAEQIAHEREVGDAPSGPDPKMLAAMLVGGAERAFYVSARGLDSRLADPAAVVAPLAALNEAAIYGDPHRHRYRVPATPRPAVEVAHQLADAVSKDTASDLNSDTARSILAAMAELLEQAPLAEISVAKILEQAGTSRASFYFYFRSKESAFVPLFRAAAAEVVDVVSEIADIAPNDAEAFNAIVRSWLLHDAVFGPVIRNAVPEWPRLPELRVAYLEAISALEQAFARLITAARAGKADPDLPADQYAATLVWTVERTIAGELAGEEHLADRTAVAEMIGQVLFAAIAGQR